ncbi:glucose 1-dehydrogenase, partial [Aureobasidium melanogenum]
MGKRRILVGYGIDVDACSSPINTRDGAKPDLTNISRGTFGATVGVPRLLDLWKKKNIKCSWYIPGHTLETFPEEMALIRDAGHEIGLHGYTHEYPGDLTREQFEATLVKTIDITTRFCGTKPKGFTAPAWKTSPEMVEVLEQHGIEYGPSLTPRMPADHSFMHHDFKPYYVPYGRECFQATDYKNHPETWMVPMKQSAKSNVVEIPGNWSIDDWPPFQFDPWSVSQGYVDPFNIERQWQEQFQWCYENYDTFIFPISIHPQVSGRPHILRMHERFIDWVNREHEGVEWCTFATMAQEFREGRI